MKTIMFLVHESYELEGFAHGKLVVHDGIGGVGSFVKNEIRDFCDVSVGKVYKCPQMSTVKVLVHESFKLEGFCTWPIWSVHSGIAIWLGGSFVKK